jgi:predicted DsbA family dithiol-disulfide isomerase
VSALPLRVEIWSDIVCPWCYIGKRRFERALAAFGRDAVSLIHRAYQLNPALPKGEVRNHHDLLMIKYGLTDAAATDMQVRVEKAAAGEGLEFHLVGGVTGNTFDAHRTLQLARQRGRQDAVLERLYRAHFTEQRSIFDTTSLADLAVEAGLDRAEAVGVLEGEAYADAVAADLRDARGLDIRGVPHYLFGRRVAVYGAQPPELFVQALAQAFAPVAPS